MAVFKFTKAAIDKLPSPDKGENQVFHFDAVVQGLGIRISPGGSKSYFVQGRVDGDKRRVTIGAHGTFVPETVRPRAIELLAEMTKGIDHRAVKAEKRAKGTTLAVVFEQFKQARNLRPKTIQVYNSAINRCFPDWLDKPITSITKDMVVQRYQKLLNTNWERGTSGVAQAHQAMRTLRAILNYAGAIYEDSRGQSILSDNPVKRLTQARIWQPVASRERIIQPVQLKDWYKAVKKLTNTTMRDYLLLILFTGLRRSEAAKLRWRDIDFQAKTLTIPAEHSKNHMEHRLPLTTFLLGLLKTRREARHYNKVQMLGNDHVFAGTGATGHIIETKRNTNKVAKDSGISFMIHDLRRSFLTYAESLDVPHYALKKLANHKTVDITGRYIHADVERLRQPMQKITDYIMSKAGIELAHAKGQHSNNLVPITR